MAGFGDGLNFFVAFFGGFLTFIAPCVLPILPAYIGYLSGVGSQKQVASPILKSRVFLNSLFFVLGVLIVFVLLGLTATTAGKYLYIYRRPVQIFGGLLLVALGLHMAGLFRIGLFARELRFHISRQITRFEFFNSFLIGLVFGFGWTPCIGPILAVILFWASQAETFWRGFFLLLSFGLGLGIPFLLLSLFTEQIMNRLRRFQQTFAAVEIIAGIFVLGVGVLLLGDWLVYLSAPLAKLGTLELWLQTWLEGF
jgi:cytochrome c-type biogenesis protein